MFDLNLKNFLKGLADRFSNLKNFFNCLAGPSSAARPAGGARAQDAISTVAQKSKHSDS